MSKINDLKRYAIIKDFVEIVAKHQGYEISSDDIFESENPRVKSWISLSEKLIDAVEKVL